MDGRWLRIVLPLLVLLQSGARAVGVVKPEFIEVAIGGRPFVLELALDPVSRFRGLSLREAPGPGKGMLFVFPSARQVGFCMRDCAFPIDILFLGENGNLLSWASMAVEPRRPGEGNKEYDARLTPYPSPRLTQFVIELAGGTLAGMKLTPGETIITIPKALAARAR
jgi:hypothetical protein